MDKFIIREINTGEIIKRGISYPNTDNNSEIIGFDYNKYEIFQIKENNKPVYDDKQETVEKIEIYTNKKSKFPKTKIFEINWKINKLSKQTIINKLNKSLVDHIDVQYPIWERIKHIDELVLDNLDEERENYIKSCKNWLNSCRGERDERENEFLVNNIFPSFEWENRPEKIK